MCTHALCICTLHTYCVHSAFCVYTLCVPTVCCTLCVFSTCAHLVPTAASVSQRVSVLLTDGTSRVNQEGGGPRGKEKCRNCSGERSRQTEITHTSNPQPLMFPTLPIILVFRHNFLQPCIKPCARFCVLSLYNSMPVSHLILCLIILMTLIFYVDLTVSFMLEVRVWRIPETLICPFLYLLPLPPYTGCLLGFPG